MESVDTLIVGAGQAGLAVSHLLSRKDCPHLLLERHRVAERWRTERWDGLRFQFPNWSVRLPDFPFPHSDPDGFATATEIVDYLAAYAAFVTAPVRCGVSVNRLRCRDGGPGFVAETSDGPVEARNVVVATGPYQRPVTPDLLRHDPIYQVHAIHYRAPDQLPPGAVLVVGSGASGAQIGEELLRAGRRVYLSIGRHRRFPRRYRGRDMTAWIMAMGLDQTPVEERKPGEVLPLITGAYGGHTIDFRRFAAQGVVLLGRVKAVHQSVLAIAHDLAASLAEGDAAYHAFLDAVDGHIEANGLEAPVEPMARVPEPDPPCLNEPIRELDLRREGIAAIVWATGYATDFSWIDVPVLGPGGQPVHRRGITDVPGMYFIGLQWLSKRFSSALAGIGEDASRVADHIASRR